MKLFPWSLLIFVLRISVIIRMEASLSSNFYADSCPNVAGIVTSSINSSAQQTNVVAPSLLRLFFHDALVQGCDASVLISSTPANKAERDFPDNLSLRQEGFDAIDSAKQAVESVCPGVVSCADILALGTRDAVVSLGGPTWEVLLGRRDGLVSTAASVQGKLPEANFDLQQLTQSFAAIGLSEIDMILLSGVHTIGFTHCDQFTDRLYDFGAPNRSDPSMDPSLVASLKQQCPQVGGDPTTVVGLDVATPFTFDTAYYSNLQGGKGILFSDQVLFNDGRTRDVVDQLASSPQSLFFSNFVNSMIALGNVSSGLPGNVRKNCTAFNA